MATNLPSAVLFDLDGTLVDTYRLYVEAYRRALAPVLGRTPDAREVTARPPAAERLFLAEWVGEERAEECHAGLRRHYADLHRALCEGPYEGVREMLAALRSAGYALGVVTGKGSAAWEITAREVGLPPFDVVVTEEDAAEPKPHPGGLLSALATLGVAPSGALYVGDSPGDLEAGRRAGTRVGAALWPKTDPADRADFLARIRPHRPDWLFERPSDVTRALAGWC